MKILPLLVATLLSAPAMALQAATLSNANLRASPSTSARVLTVIPKGSVLQTGTCTTWCAVGYGGQQGYVSKSVLAFKPGPFPAPTQIPDKNGNYTSTNKSGQPVQRSVLTQTIPAGASAYCRDGTYSFSTHRRGTCSHHGGVEQWL